jgi:outer membrane protein OmpA-like peptidoglycan-associated protein
VRLATPGVVLGLAAGLLVTASAPTSSQVDRRDGPIRMEVVQVRVGASWSTVYWRLANGSARSARLPGGLLSASPAGGSPDDASEVRPAVYASSGLRLHAPPGRTTYEPLTAPNPRPPRSPRSPQPPGAGAAERHCLCTHLGDQELGPGVELAGFTTFARLPEDVRTVTVTAPRFGTFAGVPVVRGALPGVRVDATGFAVAGVDRLPYATVLRVRRNPIQPGSALARPEPLAATSRTPQAAGEVVLVDPATLTSYTARYQDGGGCLCASFTGAYPEIGVYVFPPLPAGTRSVRVWYTGGLPVDDVAVSGAAAPAGGAPYAPWPAARPGQSEVARYPRHDELVFDAVTERDGMRRDLRSGQATVFFDLNSATVRPRARTALRRLAAELSARPGIRTIQVTGNTDRAGTEGYNLELSGRRARAVVQLLDRWISRPGIAFTVVELGEVDAAADHPSPAERARNRNAVISPS